MKNPEEFRKILEEIENSKGHKIDSAAYSLEVSFKIMVANFGYLKKAVGIVPTFSVDEVVKKDKYMIEVTRCFVNFLESAGELVEKNGEKFKEYFGSSSNKALLEFYGKKSDHRASEGRYVLMPYKGPIDVFIQDLFGSLRSTGTYIGASSLKEFPKRATFIKVNRQLTTYLEKYDQGK